jgi:hypothetical protein
MALLQVVQYVCRRSGIPSPSTVAGSTDQNIIQMLALLEEEGNDLSQRGPWQGITFEASHTSLASEDQGAIATIASNGFRYIKHDTIWDRTDILPIFGPLDGREWQVNKALSISGPRYRYRIRGGKLLINPTPPAGKSWNFEYVSKNWITDSTGVTYRQYFVADGDLILLPEELVIMGLRWRWFREKGLDYAELFRTYENQLKDMLGRDGGKQTLHADHEYPRDATPGVFVPDRNVI